MKKTNANHKRMSKNPLAMLVLFALLLTVCLTVGSLTATEKTTAYAEGEMGTTSVLSQNGVESTVILHSLDGHPDFLLVNYAPQGYAVFFRETGELLEYSLDAISEYKNAQGTLVYAGPGQHLVRIGDHFTNLIDGETIQISNIEEISTSIRHNFTAQANSGMRNKVQNNEELEQLRLSVENSSYSNGNIMMLNKTDPKPNPPPTGSTYFSGAKYITNKDFFIRNPFHANNNSTTHPEIPSVLGACGVVAAQLLLNYHSYYTDRRIIPATGNGATFRSANYGGLEYWPEFQVAAGGSNALCTNIGTTDDFFLNLLHRGGGAGMQDWTSIKKKIDQFLAEHYVGSATTKINFWDPVGTPNRVKSEIDADRPVILFMKPASGNKFHIVNAYGYHNMNGTIGFIVHYGWHKTNTQVWTNQSWYDGSIRMNVNHTHTWVDNGNTLNNIVSANTHREARCTTCNARKPVDLYNTNISVDSIEIDSVASIGGRQIQFSGNVTIPKVLKGRTVTQIGDYAFANQTLIDSISFPTSITNIGNSAFKDCTNLKTIFLFLSNNLKTIGHAAFAGCTALTGISLPYNLTKIGFEAFSSSTALTRFYGNRADIDLVVAEGTKNTYIANGWTGFNIVELSAAGPLRVISGQLRGDVEIPSYFNNRAVTEIGENAFANQTQITSIECFSVKKIGKSAFANCSELNKILYWSIAGFASAPDHSTSYSNYYYTERCLDVDLTPDRTYTLSFNYSNLTASTALTDVYTSLGVGENTFAVDLPVRKAFSSASGTQTIVFTPTEAQLSSSKKLWCRFIRTSTPQNVSIDIKNVNLDIGVTEIDIDAFTGCEKLATALNYRLLPDGTYSVTGVGNWPAGIMVIFTRTLFIPSFYNGKRVTQIDARAFANNSVVKWAFFQSELSTIGNRAFQFCYDLTTVNLSATAVTRIEDYTFDTCALGKFYFPKNLTYIGEGAFIRTGVVNVIPDSVTTIGDYAFAYRPDVLGAYLPDDLYSIGAYSFAYCDALILTNENTALTVIGPYAFYNTKLTVNTKIPAAVVTIGDSAFRNSGFSTNFSLPAGSRLVNIGPNAFANCGLTRIVLPSTVTSVAAGAFSGNAELTIYTEHSSKPSGWNWSWNSGNRPVFWGCTLSSDKTYVLSFAKSASNPSNAYATNGITDPFRKGYSFGGWYTSPDFSGTKYADLTAAPNGTLYAKWNEACVAEGSLITLADGTQKAVEDLTGSEQLLVWNLFTGKFDSAPILFIDSDPASEYEVINLTFSDGTIVKVIDEHAFWDFNLNKYVFLRSDAAKYIGHWFNKQTTDADGNMAYTRVQLTDVDVRTEYTTAWSPVTYGHLCYYVNGMLSMPGATTGLINIFDVDPDTMKIDETKYNADIAKYGLFTYEEFAAIYPVPENIFEAFCGQYLKVAMGKGLLTEDMLNSLIIRYTAFFVD